MSEPTFVRWATALKLSTVAITLIQRIRSSEPVRRVGGRFSVRGAYASTKMGRTIQFEAHTTEHNSIVDMEHDPEVREFWDQPNELKLLYKDRNGRNIGCPHTPDFLVIPTEGLPYWKECKPEAKLLELSKEMPNRYVRQSDGTWRCPPGETAAERFGLGYKVQSTQDLPSELTRNCTFLADYARADCPRPGSELIEKVLKAVRSAQGITYPEMLRTVSGLKVDELNYLIARNEIYTDLRVVLLVAPETVALYSDINVAKAIATSKKLACASVVSDAGPIQIVPTEKIRIGGDDYIITSVIPHSAS